MGFLERWSKHPQGVWARRALFQVHLWTGIVTGIYIFLISLSGSAIVFRNEIHSTFAPLPQVYSGQGDRLNEQQLREIAAREYPDYSVSQVWISDTNPDRAVEIWLTNADEDHLEILFHPHTGANLGEAIPLSIKTLDWLVDFHDNLLNSDTGRMANGIGGLVLAVLCLTGAVIWWPGIRSWRGSVGVDVRANWKRLNWNLHSSIGFWSFLLVFMWAISGFYLAIPQPFAAVVDYFEPLPDEIEGFEIEFQPQGSNAADQPAERFGDFILRWLSRLHFGRYFGWPAKVIWTILGLIPPVLLLTGVIMWWNRVVRPAR